MLINNLGYIPLLCPQEYPSKKDKRRRALNPNLSEAPDKKIEQTKYNFSLARIVDVLLFKQNG